MSEYAVNIRRQLHMHPEIGFDLPCTLALVKGELDSMGVEYTEKFGKSSIVAVLNSGKPYTVAIRADMDALPVKEKNKVSYKSKIDGTMHACGHDVHTAILLGTVRELNKVKEKINSCVKFIFQAAEEFAPGGGNLMCRDGVMNDIDEIISLHCDEHFDAGTIAVNAGPQGANMLGFDLEFYGKSAHSANRHDGIDAISMSIRTYMLINTMLLQEIPAKELRVFNVGAINGGTANNIVCDYCKMSASLRTYKDETNEIIEKKINNIIKAVALESGGKIKLTKTQYFPYVVNDLDVVKKIRFAAGQALGAEKVLEDTKRSTTAEDFSFYTRLKPGAMMRLGIRKPGDGEVPGLHQSTFDIDESCIKTGIDVFAAYILNV